MSTHNNYEPTSRVNYEQTRILNSSGPPTITPNGTYYS